MAGYITAPIASMVTIDEPEMAANTAHERMVATASPPGIGLRQRGKDADQPLRDGAARHDVAAQDEERDRQDHLLVEPDPHVLDDVLEVAAPPEQVNAGSGGKQHHQQRLAQNQQAQDRADQRQRLHVRCSVIPGTPAAAA